MKVACLFDGAGLARLGLELAGLDVIGYELDPAKHALSLHVGSGNSILADVRDVDLSGFDAVWASPPCQVHSSARTQGEPTSEYATDLLNWALALPHRILWVENVTPQGRLPDWGVPYNAAQFEQEPRQQRRRMIGGRYPEPQTFRPFQRMYSPEICFAITATEWKGCASDARRASRWYGRKLTVDDCAYRMGFDIPAGWRAVPDGWTATAWRNNIYQAIGNGVPPFMSRAFGEAVTGQVQHQVAQAGLWGAL